MKMTKTLAIIFAVVLVVVCFNAPAVNSLDGTSLGHPWDGDSGDRDDGGNDLGEDTTGTTGNILLFNSVIPPNGGQNSSVGKGTFVVAIHMLFVYHDLPGFYSEMIGAFGANENVVFKTSTR